jgi:hypothetical protein
MALTRAILFGQTKYPPRIPRHDLSEDNRRAMPGDCILRHKAARAQGFPLACIHIQIRTRKFEKRRGRRPMTKRRMRERQAIAKNKNKDEPEFGGSFRIIKQLGVLYGFE